MKQIIIVEDDLLLSLLLEKQVKRMGYHVAAKANNGEDAVEAIRKHLPDLILMDIKLLGEMDGVEVIEQARHFTDAPVLYLTGNSDETTRRRARATDPIDYMVKPVDMEELTRTIQQVLEKTYT